MGKVVKRICEAMHNDMVSVWKKEAIILFVVLLCSFVNAHAQSTEIVVKGKLNEAVSSVNVMLAVIKNNSDLSSINDEDIGFVDFFMVSDNFIDYKFEFSGDAGQYKIIIVQRGKILFEKRLDKALNINGKLYFETEYMATKPETGVYIPSVKFGNEPVMYEDLVLPVGNLDICVDVEAVDYSGDVTLFAAIFDNNNLKSAIYLENKPVTAGNSTEFYFSFDVEDEQSQDNELKIFAIDSIENFKLISNVYTLSADGFFEKKLNSINNTAVTDLQVVMGSSGFNVINDTVAGYATFMIVESGTEILNLDFSKVAYLGIVEVDGDNETYSELMLNETLPEVGGEYDIYVGGTTIGREKLYEKVFYYTQAEIQSYYEDLNGTDITVSIVDKVIHEPVLHIDLTDYNKLGNDKENALQLFIASKGNTLMQSTKQIQAILDYSVGIVLASKYPSARVLDKYGEMLGLKQEYYSTYILMANTEKVAIASLMDRNKLTGNNLTANEAGKIFEDAFVTYKVKQASSYYYLYTMVFDTFGDYFNIKLSDIDDAGLSSADVFKKMYNNKSNYYNISDVEKDYSATIKSLKGNSQGGGGGGGGSNTVSKKLVEALPEGSYDNETSLFEDVSPSCWAYSYIKYLTDSGIISKDNYYRPDESITREEFVKLIVTAFSLESKNNNINFVDVGEEAWYRPYISAAVENTIITGYSELVFGVGDSINRQDAAVILYRLINSKNPEYLEANGNQSNNYEDYISVSDYATEAVEAMTALGIFNGYEDNTFKPLIGISRAECAKIIVKTIEAI